MYAARGMVLARLVTCLPWACTCFVAPIQADTVSNHQSFEPEMVWVRGGCFQMGSSGGETGRLDDEPRHRVCVEGFYISKYETKQSQWKAVMGDNPSFLDGSNRPVESVSWDDVQIYIRKLNDMTGRPYRLPTEAEWEFACRSGGEPDRYCGGDDVNALAWYAWNAWYQTHRVGGKRANRLGLHDMSGNVWEWTCSEYDRDYGGDETRCSSVGGGDRVVRGGAWSEFAFNVRAASRNRHDVESWDLDVGFRLVRD